MVTPGPRMTIDEIIDALERIDNLLKDTIDEMKTAIADMNDAIASSKERIAEIEAAQKQRRINPMPPRDAVVKEKKKRGWLDR